MLNHNPKIGRRPRLARLVLGGAAVGALALTASSLPTRIVYAAEPEAPPAPAAPVADSSDGETAKGRRVIVIEADEGDTKDGGDTKKERRIIMHRIGEGEAGHGEAPRVMMFEGKDGEVVRIGAGVAPLAPLTGLRAFGLNSDDLRTALKEQGIDDAKIDAIVKRVEEKRKEALRISFNWDELSKHHSLAGANAVAIAKCKDGEAPRVMIDRSDEASGGKRKVQMVHCNYGVVAREKQVEAMKRARDRLAAQKDHGGMSAEIRASVVADLDKAIAEFEAKKD